MDTVKSIDSGASFSVGRRFFAALVLFVLAIVLFAEPALAQSRRMREVGRTQAGGSSNPSSGSDVSAHSAKRDLFRQLLSAETPSLSWPAFPRIWVERSVSDWHTTNTSLGLQIPVIHTGGKLSLEYTYSLRTSVILISSLRPVSENSQFVARSTNDLIADHVGEESMVASILKWDEKSNSVYPKVREGYPMTGFCAFEARLSMEESGRGGIDFFGTGAVVEKGQTEVNQQMIFSNFFQIRSDISVRSYLEDVCNKIFREKVEKTIVDDFSKLVIERMIAKNPGHACQPPRGDEISLEIGDPSCLDWHKTSVPATTRKVTVPRCLLHHDGAYRCALQARENVSCPLYMDAKTGEMTDSIQSPRTIRVAGGHREFPCDSNQGLSCQMVKDPFMLLNRPLFAGQAVCRPMK